MKLETALAIIDGTIQTKAAVHVSDDNQNVCKYISCVKFQPSKTPVAFIPSGMLLSIF